jgi:hypothetical protein
MNTSRLIIAATVLALAGAAYSADKVDKYTEKNEAKLAQRLEGRTAGEPVDCIPLMKSNELEVIEGVGLVYESGDILYVARPIDANKLSRDDVVLMDRYGSQLCYTDVVRTVDRYGGFYTGSVFLGKFVPYKKQG